MLAILLGASTFPGAPKLAEGRAFYISAADVKEYLWDEHGLGMPWRNVLSLFDDSRPPSDQLIEVASFLVRRTLELRSEGSRPEALLIYYVGHGLFTRGDQAYCLAVRYTNEINEGATSIRAGELAGVIKENAAFLRRYLILDCCFAASIHKEFQSGALTAARVQIEKEFPQRGTALLCSSNSREPSLAPQGLDHTMFSHALMQALRKGHAGGGPQLSFSELGELVKENLCDAFPESWVRPEVHSPDQCDGDIAYIPLFPNPAYRERTTSEERARQEREGAEAAEKERIAAERVAAERAALEEAEQQRFARERAEAERAEAQKKAEERFARKEEEAKRAAPNAAAPTPTPSVVPEFAPLSEGARIVDTFIAPSKTFTDLRRNASWWVPWLLISAVSLLFVFAMGRQIGFEQISKNSIAQSSRAEQFEKLPADQQAKQIQISSTIARYISYSLPVLNLIIFVIIAAVLMATFNFGAGASVPFKTSLAIVIYGSLPGIIGAVLGIISMFSGVDPAGFNARNPVATNPGYFMDPMGNKFLYGMASALDVFVIWSIVLLGIGFACNSKVKRSTAIAIVAGWYLLYKLVTVGIAAAIS